MIKAILKNIIFVLTKIKFTSIYQTTSPICKKLIPPILWEHAVSTRNHLLNKIRTIINDRSYQLELDYRANNVGLQADTILFRPGIKLSIHPHCRRILEDYCYIDPAQVDETNCFLEATKGRNSLLDIGALYGMFSLIFALQCPWKKALAVEASPIPFPHLLYNIKKNKLTHITAVECALSDGSGSLAMHYEREHAVAAGTQGKKNIIHIPMLTGDQLCQSQDFHPDIIKIDVEGHEIKVLKGLTEMITKYSPFIFLEVHPSRIQEERDSTSFLEVFFSALGYSATLVSGEPFPLTSFRDMKYNQRFFLKPSEVFSGLHT